MLQRNTFLKARTHEWPTTCCREALGVSGGGSGGGLRRRDHSVVHTALLLRIHTDCFCVATERILTIHFTEGT